MVKDTGLVLFGQVFEKSVSETYHHNFRGESNFVCHLQRIREDAKKNENKKLQSIIQKIKISLFSVYSYWIGR